MLGGYIIAEQLVRWTLAGMPVGRIRRPSACWWTRINTYPTRHKTEQPSQYPCGYYVGHTEPRQRTARVTGNATHAGRATTWAEAPARPRRKCEGNVIDCR